MKIWFRRTLMVLMGVVSLTAWEGRANCSETYRIDENPVLLYKIVNWWYDCLPGECHSLCGRTIECVNRGNVRVAYDEGKKRLVLRVDGGFADQLAILESCGDCFGPAALVCRRLNTVWFGGAEAVVASSVDRFRFDRVEPKQARAIEAVLSDIVFVMVGRVAGLKNGRIALHPAGPFLYRCSMDPTMNPADTAAAHPILFRIMNGETNETMAEYEARWE